MVPVDPTQRDDGHLKDAERRFGSDQPLWVEGKAGHAFDSPQVVKKLVVTYVTCISKLAIFTIFTCAIQW